MKKFKVFLVENEIYFKTILYCLLGVSSLCISFQTCRINQFNQQISIQDKLPIINIRSNFIQDQNSENGLYELKIVNTGGKIKKILNIDNYSYLYISNNKQNKIIPTDFFYGIIESDLSINLLGGISSGYYREFMDINNRCFKQNMFYSLTTIIKVTYIDFMNNQINQFFKVESGVIVTEISSEEYDSLYNNYKKNQLEFKSFDIISDRDLGI